MVDLLQVEQIGQFPRVVYLSCLAPDLAMRILKGEHPQDLTARKLLDWVPLPERWEDQRKLMALNV